MNELHGNVLAAISSCEADYKVHSHSKFSSEISSPQDFAAALGYQVQRITKSLFLRSHDGGTYAVAVCSINQRLDFKLTAEAIGVKRLAAAGPEDLAAKTGYPRNGVSPLGLAPDIAVVVDALIFDYPTVLIGGGAAAIEIELAPADLVQISGARVKSITA
jgi:Cys-tRNA(Pro)/Cys-tRNA(Cys) deacylase